MSDMSGLTKIAVILFVLLNKLQCASSDSKEDMSQESPYQSKLITEKRR